MTRNEKLARWAGWEHRLCVSPSHTRDPVLRNYAWFKDSRKLMTPPDYEYSLDACIELLNKLDAEFDIELISDRADWTCYIYSRDSRELIFTGSSILLPQAICAAVEKIIDGDTT